MKILIVAATTLELEPLLTTISSKNIIPNPISSFAYNQSEITILITGAGIMSTTFQLTKLLAKERFDLALNLGIAGSFDATIPLGTMVEIVAEEIADLGAEDDNNFIPIKNMPFFDAQQFPFTNGILDNPQTALSIIFDHPPLRQVRGLTVNKVTGNQQTIRQLMDLFEGDVESMESAAFFYVCLQYQIPFMAVRSIANYVEVRDTSRWQIPLAVKNLNAWFIEQFLPRL